jgi:hypothetical protein
VSGLHTTSPPVAAFALQSSLGRAGRFSCIWERVELSDASIRERLLVASEDAKDVCSDTRLGKVRVEAGRVSTVRRSERRCDYINVFLGDWHCDFPIVGVSEPTVAEGGAVANRTSGGQP